MVRGDSLEVVPGHRSPGSSIRRRTGRDLRGRLSLPRHLTQRQE
ncbi:hypothetical protein Hamer_G022068 [Homarus americanus]|uniref:Uncharacterized protein n=1 Tax=Homarus americanus TaxID=6706 RepID=A0A8J5TIN8_HOMAM|nr:hypothetical protein Hamer_G022068 [Homarus americanus]